MDQDLVFGHRQHQHGDGVLRPQVLQQRRESTAAEGGKKTKQRG